MLTSKELKERKSECLSHYENETEIIVSMPVDELIDLLENQEKLTQAIEILKDKFKIEVERRFCYQITISETNELKDNTCVSDFLTKEEYELLKEVLGNDN